MAILQTLPDRPRPLPTPGQLDRLLQVRYAVMIVAGRSGSGLIQSYLDGHRQVAQIPSIWKFHDFLAAYPALGQSDGAAAAEAFTRFAPHALLFDTRLSTNLGGQLGPGGDLAVLVDKGSFTAAMAAALAGGPLEPRRILCAAVLAYEWCLGRELGEFRCVLHHLHHGDWLWPELAPEPYNLSGLTPLPALRLALKPDLLLVSLRDPRAVLKSYPMLAAAIAETPQACVTYYELLLRLLAQDWLRARVAAGSDVPTAGVRLEDIKRDRAGTFAALCDRLGVDALDSALERTTFYGHAWTEDRWTAARNALQAKRPDLDVAPCWQDEAFLQALLGDLAEEAYPGTAGGGDWNALLDRLLRAADDPPYTLFADMKSTPEGRAAAATRAWDRIGFAERFRALAAAQRLGPLALCRPGTDARVAVSA